MRQISRENMPLYARIGPSARLGAGRRAGWHDQVAMPCCQRGGVMPGVVWCVASGSRLRMIKVLTIDSHSGSGRQAVEVSGPTLRTCRMVRRAPLDG